MLGHNFAKRLESKATWEEIEGTFYSGVSFWERLADLSEYQGDRDFKDLFPYP